MTVWYFFICYREGWVGMIASSSEPNREPLVHLSSDLAIFSCTLPSRLPLVTSNLFRATHQKYSCSLYKCRQGSIQKSPVQTKMIGEASSSLGKVLRKNLAFTPKG